IENTYPGLRRTFTPYDTRNISRKKLALTLGIKAAHNPIVLFLTSESRLPGPYWLSAMTAPFHDRDIDMVLGYAGPGKSDTDSRRLSRGMHHDILISDMEWLADAIDSKPWRGDGDNMGIRRSMFFSHMGFGNSLNLQYGDDDVFVSEVATDSNTAVVLSPDSRVTTEAPDDTPGILPDKARTPPADGKLLHQKAEYTHRRRIYTAMDMVSGHFSSLGMHPLHKRRCILRSQHGIFMHCPRQHSTCRHRALGHTGHSLQPCGHGSRPAPYAMECAIRIALAPHQTLELA
ncbi:MAG: hypothetical protein K2G79_00555, partial [Muribaculum sp.]|nr:hypothetical protein [Muribaculum sp.]